MRWRGSIYRFALCTCGFVCMTLVPSSQTQTFGVCNTRPFPVQDAARPTGTFSSHSSSTRHRYGRLYRIKEHARSSVLPSLDCKLCSENRDLAVEPSLGLAPLPSGTVGARLLLPSVLLSLDLSFVRPC
jgi:hypothetical protein